MIDPKLLRAEFDTVREKLQTRGLPADFDSWPQLDERRRAALVEVEEIRAHKNKLGPEIAKAKKEGTNVDSLLAELKAKGERQSELDKELEEVQAKLQTIELTIPNIADESVPVGTDEEANRVEKEWGDKPSFSFEPKPHWDVGEALGILDFDRAAKLSGARFSILAGMGARLERALINFMLDTHMGKGYKEIMPPLLVKSDAMTGAGQLPKFEEDAFKTADFHTQLYLIPTSEVTLVNLHADEILDEADLPLYYTAYTPCFRAEAGSHGRDVRGLIRLHQFNKVELVKITTPESSFEEHEKLTADAESILEALKLPYRRVTLSTGDAGIASAKTYDLEVWLPSFNQYREISSCTNATDYQSRRVKARYRPTGGGKPEFVHMLNGSGLAVGRTLVAILENYQREDGSVEIPLVLRPYMGGLAEITKG